MKKQEAIIKRAIKTLVQSAIASAATSMLAVIGTATTLGEVNWATVASTAVLSMIVSVLMNLKTKLPECEEETINE